MYEDKAHHDFWGTPKSLFNDLDREFNFTLDPAGNLSRLLKDDMITITPDGCHVPVALDVKPSVNGLIYSWKDHRVFVNPPYSEGQMWDWVKKAYKERDNAEVIVMLIPVRTDRKAFHKYIYHVAEMNFLIGRISFFDISKNKIIGASMHSSMICVWRKDHTVTQPKNIILNYDPEADLKDDNKDNDLMDWI